MSDFDGWLTTLEASEYMRCNTETVRKMIRAGDLQARKFGQSYRITREWCDEYMMSLEAA